MAESQVLGMRKLLLEAKNCLGTYFSFVCISLATLPTFAGINHLPSELRVGGRMLFSSPRFDLASVLSLMVAFNVVAAEAQNAPKGNASKVQLLYEQSQYQAAADQFELEAGHSTSGMTYYAVLANLRCHRTLRAKQLAHYVIERYPGTTEATLCEAVLRSAGDSAGSSKPADDSGASKSSRPADAAGVEKDGARKLLSASTPSSASAASPAGQPERVQYPRKLFTAEEIAKVGASGVDQTSKPNCWFEASLAALARLPRGQRMIADMITQIDPQTYVVKFPNDGNEYKIAKTDLRGEKIHDSALWAGLIDYAESKRYPHNENMSQEKTWVETALACVCGGRVETASAKSLAPNELSSFIGGAVSSQNPCVCATSRIDSLPPIVVEGHAYTITGFDASRQLITLRNPHGRYSKSFSRLPDDPQESHFKQLKGGFLQIDIDTFQKYFATVSRAFI